MLREQERNDKIYEKILKGQKKSEMFGATSAWYLYCYAGCGLMYFKTERGGFVGFGADKTYNIYRYADLAAYEEIDGNSAIDNRMKNGEPYIHLVFNGDYAVRDVYMPIGMMIGIPSASAAIRNPSQGGACPWGQMRCKHFRQIALCQLPRTAFKKG